MAVRAEFYRSGGAYLWDNGALMANELPRFETGKFAGTRALRIEEGTTNILTENQSNVETDGTGFFAVNSPTAGSRSLTHAFEGAASFKVTCSATSGSGYFVSVSTSTEATYVGRLRMRGDTGTVYAANSFTYALRIGYTDATIEQINAVATPDESWQDLVTAPIVSNPGKTVSGVNMYFTSTGTALNGTSFYVDALQIERQSAARTWHVGGGTRNRERCLIPTEEIFDPSAGTIEAWVWIEDIIDWHTVCDTRQLGDNFSQVGRCILRTIEGTGYLSFPYWNGTTAITLSDPVAVPIKQWVHIAVSWGAFGVRLYRAGVLRASHPDIPVLVRPARMFLGSRADGLDASSGIRIAGMRFTKGATRTDAEILEGFNTNAQFTEDRNNTRVFPFDGTLRSLLSPQLSRAIADSAFLTPVSVTASSSATNFLASNCADYEFPLLSHRTTSTAQATLTFDFGAVVNFCAVFIAHVNWEWVQVATSYNGVTYTNVNESPLACEVDEADQYRKVGVTLSASGQYARLTIVAQVADGNAAYYETPLVIFAGDMDTLAVNPSWGMQIAVEHDYESTNAGGHSEVQARGRAYLTMQVRGVMQRGREVEWQKIATLGNHHKFLFFQALGKTAECYLMRGDGSAQWEEDIGVTAFSLRWREHVN